MKIGMDLSGVVFDSEKYYRVLSEIYDVSYLERNSIINSREKNYQQRYSWSPIEISDFQSKYDRIITETANFMPGVKEVLTLLHNEGHELVVITASNGLNGEAIPITQKRFEEYGIAHLFHKCFWKTTDKVKVCKEEHIDIMIDDDNSICISLSKAKIQTIYLKDAPSYELSNNQYLTTLYNWGEIYRHIKSISANK